MRADSRHNNVKNISSQEYNFFSKPLPFLPGAACHNNGIDPEIYYPFPKRLNKQTMKQVRDICDGCPVRLKCLEFAISNNEQWGIWGGMTRKQRVELVKKRKLDAKVNTPSLGRKLLETDWRGTQTSVQSA